MPFPAFRFKKFSVAQHGAAHLVGTDAVLLGAWADVGNAHRFLDIGTGTGVVSLMLAQRLSHSASWSGVGVEIHAPSAALARENFIASPWHEHLEVWEGAVQQFSPTLPFDLIVSNPPFFSETTVSPDKDRSLGRHTASLSAEDLLAAVSRLLAPQGRFCVILPEREGRNLRELSVPMGLYWTKICEVRSRPGKPVERVLMEFRKHPQGFQKEEICLFASQQGDEYAAEYRAMTRELM